MAPRPLVLFVPCYVDQLRPSAGIAAVELLESLGHAIEVRSAALCCGQPFTNSGCAEEGRATTDHWYRVMEGAERVVVISSSCAVHLRHERGDAGVRPEVLELCEFLVREHPQRAAGRLERRVCLHSSCHGIRDSAADVAARAALGAVAGLELVQAERGDECCGFGGSFAVTFPELSVKMGRDRLAEIEATAAPEVVATDLSCLLHLEGIARARRLPINFRHVAELLREALT